LTTLSYVITVKKTVLVVIINMSLLSSSSARSHGEDSSKALKRLPVLAVKAPGNLMSAEGRRQARESHRSWII